mgnify:CR=1 FL=1
MKNKIVEEAYNDYFEHLEKFEDNNYSSIYRLVELFEGNWNCYGGANLKYDINIKNDYLYLENVKICPMNDLLSCSTEADSIKYQLRNNRYLCIVVHWVDGEDAYIDQIYIQNKNDEDDCKILYDK